MNEINELRERVAKLECRLGESEKTMKQLLDGILNIVKAKLENIPEVDDRIYHARR